MFSCQNHPRNSHCVHTPKRTFIYYHQLAQPLWPSLLHPGVVSLQKHCCSNISRGCWLCISQQLLENHHREELWCSSSVEAYDGIPASSNPLLHPFQREQLISLCSTDLLWILPMCQHPHHIPDAIRHHVTIVIGHRTWKYPCIWLSEALVLWSITFFLGATAVNPSIIPNVTSHPTSVLFLWKQHGILTPNHPLHDGYTTKVTS